MTHFEHGVKIIYEIHFAVHQQLFSLEIHNISALTPVSDDTDNFF